MPQHIERRHSIVLAGPPDRVFDLFTPRGESAWVPGWHPQFLHPHDGTTQEGMVFRTDHGGEETLWGCVLWAPAVHRVRYVRVTPGSRFGFVEVRCRDAAGGKTQADIAYTLTALTGDGDRLLGALTDRAFADMIGAWQPLIDGCLREHPLRH